MKELIIYALPKGETERYMEQIIATQCRTDADVAKVKAAAAADGWHSFRVATFQMGEMPDFVAAVIGRKRK